MSSSVKFNAETCQEIIELGGEDVIKCYQCGRCMPACPWNLLHRINYAVYRFPQTIKIGSIIQGEKKEDIAKETLDIFRCVGCDSCHYECPRGVNISHILRAVRRILVDYGSYPAELKSFVLRIYNTGNPFGETAEKRAAWASGLDIPRFESKLENLYFSCCVPAYDSRAKSIAQATARILKLANVSFGILGNEEFCCAEAVRRIGAEKVFQAAVKNNTEAFAKYGVKKVLTTSPHCYTIFKKEYSKYYDKFDAIHMSQFINQLIKEKKIIAKKPFNKTVVYHDPCTLGRQMGVYDEPREVLRSIPGLKLAEVPIFNREYSVCCGGGGVGTWYDWSKDERIAEFRIKQLLATGAEVIAVACPYCLQMFEETMKSMNLALPVMDIAEILYESLG